MFWGNQKIKFCECNSPRKKSEWLSKLLGHRVGVSLRLVGSTH